MNFLNLRYKIIAIAVLFSFAVSFAYTAEFVKVVRNEEGSWKLTVDGWEYFVKGLEYSADMVGRRPDVNEWMWSDINRNRKIDGPYDSWVDADRDDFQAPDENDIGDFALLKAMGCNTIRIYHSENINKELLRDLYETYGIMTIMGNYLGAYTQGSGANWREGTDYNDPLQREKMKESVRQMILDHKDEPYVLMWMLGNENDTPGLEVNSTKTNTNALQYPEVYAKFVNEVAIMIKQIDANHPVGICNATTGFLRHYAEHSQEIDILGFNQYTGPYGFGTLWGRVKATFDRPVLITEFGCDSWNSKKKAPDERFQAQYHRGAWRDIERNSYWGNSESKNSIGGVIYCWLDKWWLIGSARVHDTDLGAWPGPKNCGYFHDEWFGISSQGDGKQSPFKRQLKEVYFVYQEELWADDITRR
ncbi:MAG: hypothetical protein FWF00_06290 [Endomicrobia bacterium]|nr:hypothetical protein [Endomicrobiia bacterium]MCL2507275.1 hypothetical protein [Endomicrobiia bacterium]